jgi:hypothetical protein
MCKVRRLDELNFSNQDKLFEAVMAASQRMEESITAFEQDQLNNVNLPNIRNLVVILAGHPISDKLRAALLRGLANAIALDAQRTRDKGLATDFVLVNADGEIEVRPESHGLKLIDLTNQAPTTDIDADVCIYSFTSDVTDRDMDSAKLYSNRYPLYPIVETTGDMELYLAAKKKVTVGLRARNVDNYLFIPGAEPSGAELSTMDAKGLKNYLIAAKERSIKIKTQQKTFKMALMWLFVLLSVACGLLGYWYVRNDAISALDTVVPVVPVVRTPPLPPPVPPQRSNPVREPVVKKETKPPPVVTQPPPPQTVRMSYKERLQVMVHNIQQRSVLTSAQYNQLFGHVEKGRRATALRQALASTIPQLQGIEVMDASPSAVNVYVDTAIELSSQVLETMYAVGVYAAVGVYVVVDELKDVVVEVAQDAYEYSEPTLRPALEEILIARKWLRTQLWDAVDSARHWIKESL